MPMDKVKRVGARERYHRTIIEDDTFPEKESGWIVIFTDGYIYIYICMLDSEVICQCCDLTSRSDCY